MSLQPGSRLGPYEIVRTIGAGGMGEVFLARDTRLHRDVAIKILPAVFAEDEERIARFSREAQTLAALNHQHIAQIYGVEEGSDGTRSSTIRALVMEFVGGETLADRIARGGLSIEETIPIARQIAEALAAAHEAGIIHRDLKPANVKLRPDGTVKVLDFGLAKVVGSDGPITSAADSPTLSLAATHAGVILGTAPYMSPEQAKGRPVDRRTDIFSFGCVLYEMLTGRRAFDGEDVAEVLGAVLKSEPDWSRLPSGVTASTRKLLRACLAKDPRKRRGSAADVLIDLDDVQRGEDVPVARPSARRPHALLWASAGAALATVVLASLWYFRQQPDRPLMQFEVTAPPGTSMSVQPDFEISPDGQHIAFVAGDSRRSQQVWLRSLQEESARALPGTQGASAPFWSPDSRFIAFSADGQLKQVGIAGERPQTLASIPSFSAGTWNSSDVILISGAALKGIYRVSALGGVEPSPVTTLNTTRGEVGHVMPRFLPDGRRFLFNVRSTAAEHAGLYLGSLDSTEVVKLLGNSTSKAQYVPPDLLLFVRGQTLFVQLLDLQRTRLIGEPARVADGIVSNPSGFSGFSASDTGVLVLRSALNEAAFDLSWYDRTGKHLSRVAAGLMQGIDVSPSGTQLAAHRHEGTSQGDVWITDLGSGTQSRFTFEPAADNSSPIWSPDGTVVAFSALRNGKWAMYRKAADLTGTDELLYESDTPVMPMTWARNGQALLFTRFHPQTLNDLWSLPLVGERQPTPIVQTAQSDTHAQISPDGRWMSYRSGTVLYVQRYPPAGREYTVASGLISRWRADGRELFFNAGDAIWAVSVEAGDTALRLGTPTKLFDWSSLQIGHRVENLAYWTYAVSADGQRFLIPRQLSDTDESARVLRVLLNWQAALNRRTPRS